MYCTVECLGIKPAVCLALSTVHGFSTTLSIVNCNILQGPDIIIHQPDAVLDAMGDWCKEHHGKVTHAVKYLL